MAGSRCQENIIVDTRKRKRMLSNRESARRSRMRKQKQLDDLTAQVNNLTAENNLIVDNINFATRLYLNVESENSVLRAQLSELNHRLKALSDIVDCMSYNDAFAPGFEIDHIIGGGVDDHVLCPWSLVHVNQPIMY